MRRIQLLAIITMGMLSCKQKIIEIAENPKSTQRIKETFQEIFTADNVDIVISILRKENTNNDSLIANIYFQGGMRYFQLSKYEEARELFQKTEVLYKQLGKQNKSTQMLSNQAVILGLLGEYSQAIEIYLGVLDYYKKFVTR